MILAVESVLHCGCATEVYTLDGTRLYNSTLPELQLLYNRLDRFPSQVACSLVSVLQVSSVLSDLLHDYDNLLVTNYLAPILGVVNQYPEMIYKLQELSTDIVAPDFVYLDYAIPLHACRRLESLLPIVFPGLEVACRTPAEVVQCLVPNDGKRLLINA